MTRSGSVANVPAPSGTVTFLFSDIEGSTQRWARDRAAMQQSVHLHDRLMREAIAANAGHVFKTIGDAFCAAFATPESAAAAALDAQRALGAANFSEVGGLRVRMAINTGTADERDGDYFGPTVNRVARLLALGHGGQVLLSSMAAGLVRENPPPQTMLVDLGEHVLKDLEGHEHVYQLVAPDLQRDFPALSARRASGPWLVPDAMHTRYFTGRDDLLARLRRQLAERHCAVLSGLGGVGKTQAAIEYAVRYRAEYPSGVFWVNAETIGQLTSGFVAIAETIGLAGAESTDHAQIVKAVLQWLNRTESWLLVLDNADDRREVQPLVPEPGHGDLLITSRESVFPELGIPRALEVRDLNGDDAVRFLLARTGREDAEPDDRAAACELAADLGNLPLALEQAAAYIAETAASFSAYLSAFRKRRVTLLEKAVGLVAHDTVAVTWAANFEAVQRASPASAEVLRVSAFLAPDGIPFELFLDGAQELGDSIAEAFADPDDLAITEVLRPLARYSLIRSDAMSRVFSVHRLVQETVSTAISESERRTYVDRAVCALDAAFPDGGYVNFVQCERLVPHVVSIARWVGAYDVRTEAAGGALNRAGRYLWERGRYAEARALHQCALAIGERVHGPGHPDVARSLNNLANDQFALGHYAEAQALHERALAIRECALGPEDPNVAESLNNLANVHLTVGRYDAARTLYERALGIREGALGSDHPDVAETMNNVANVNLALGEYADAQRLYERALTIWERALGPDHPDIAISINNLALVHSEQGRHAEAQRLYERALTICERALGPDHPDVALGLSNLAETYGKQGRYAEAQQLVERALAIWERELGADHPFVAEGLTGLANICVHQGRYAEAEPLYERALGIRERALGPDHEHVAQTLIGLASLRRQQGHDAEAVALYERARVIKERTFAADHPELAEIRNAIDSLRTAMTSGANQSG
jgi:tetratricopeptide (TPR) repeat protein/class 3 adenylate cyclase